MIYNCLAKQNNFTSNLISNSNQINANFDTNFEQTNKIDKIDESDQTESFDQSDDLYQIYEFLRQTSLSSFFFKDAYEADFQMQRFICKINKFLFLEQKYQHDQQNNLQNQT